ncbi:MAG: MBOAT family protein, partial [Bacteroidales bacterium]|nr:MBOAT family protein [Bacteroidales bacterium]
MLFQSGQLFFCILLFITVFVVCKWVFRKSWLNNVVLLLGNALVLTNIVRLQSVLILLIVATVCYGAGVLLQRKKWRWLLALTLVLLVALFAIRSYPLVWKWFGEFWTTNMKKPFFSVEKLGLSYILFRLIHWLVECRRGTLRTRNFLSYINYLFFFPTFMAGPIDTLNNFHYWMNTTHVRFNARMLLAGVGRIFLGAVKALLVVPLMLPYATDYQTFLSNMGPWGAVICAALLYSLYIYIDFSGYCDMAIGMAYMMGIRTPENFNNPYLSANVAEFWKRWHITFSTFLKIYVFKPVVGLLNRFPIRK